MHYSGIAQLVEHLTVNQVVVSSSLTAGATKAAGEFLIGRFFVEWGMLNGYLVPDVVCGLHGDRRPVYSRKMAAVAGWPWGTKPRGTQEAWPDYCSRADRSWPKHVLLRLL